MKYSNIKQDINGYFFLIMRRKSISFKRIISNLLIKPIIYLKGVEIGRNCNFHNWAVIQRTPLSRITIGANCTFRSDFKSNLVGVNRKCVITTLRKHAEIVIKDRSGFSGTVIAAAEKITIGENVLCGANTLITDFDWHPIDPILRFENKGKSKSKPIKIGNNVWLGINAVVLKGVSIGENSVIGANSVVIKDIPSNVVAAGNPCIVKKSLNKVL